MTRLAAPVALTASWPARPPLFDLAPGEVCPAAAVTRSAVRSYRTVSPLLAFTLRLRRSGLFSVALSLGSPPAAVSRHRVVMEPGLSSTDMLCSTAFRAAFAITRTAAAVRPAGGRDKRRMHRQVKPGDARRKREVEIYSSSCWLATCWALSASVTSPSASSAAMQRLDRLSPT